MKYIVEADEHVQMISLIAVREGTAIMITGSVEKFQTADKELEEAYQKGFEAGQHEATTLEYQQGLDDAWGTIIKIALIPYAERSEIFDGQQDILSIVQKFSLSEVTAKLREYEQQKAEVKVGDEVRNTLGLMDNAVGFVIGTTIEGDYNVSRYIDGKIKTGTWRRENCARTGKHSYAVERMVAVLKGEQENNCLTCRHDGDSAYCEGCKDYKLWQPKGDDNCDTCKHQNNPNGVRCRNCYDGMYLYQWEQKEGAE